MTRQLIKIAQMSKRFSDDVQFIRKLAFILFYSLPRFDVKGFLAIIGITPKSIENFMDYTSELIE